MSEIYITLTGTKYYYGKDFLKSGMKVRLVKEPENEFDKEAIRAEKKGLGTIAHVANSPHTVIGESLSAGRVYDRIGKKAVARVVHVLPQGVLCRIEKKSLKKK